MINILQMVVEMIRTRHFGSLRFSSPQMLVIRSFHIAFFLSYLGLYHKDILSQRCFEDKMLDPIK